MDSEDVRLAVYTWFARLGRAPSHDELADALSVPVPAVVDALRVLAAGRHVVLDEDDGIAMAHPFSAVPLGFSVMGRRTLWWGGCAWDAFALPHLLTSEPDVLVATRCPGCDRALSWVVSASAPPAGDEVAHFLVPVARMWDDVVRTCSNQRLFCSQACVDSWLATKQLERGYVMDLAQLWRLASHWYDGRLARGYVRREPSAAADYLRSVGLLGEFWGLPSR